jgi:hypothetical protein
MFTSFFQIYLLYNIQIKNISFGGWHIISLDNIEKHGIPNFLN